MEKNIVMVNGTAYDAVTGMPIEESKSQSSLVTDNEQIQRPRQAAPSHAVHKRTTAPKTINRRPIAEASTPTPTVSLRTSSPIAPRSAKSPNIARFTPQSSAAMHRPRVMSDIRPASQHPIAKKAEQRLQATKSVSSPAIKPSSVLKNEAISQALDKAPAHRSAAKPIKKARGKSRMLSFASAALSLLLLAGYLTYINLPNLSVRVAANQAGIEASYPGYRPDGYRLAGVNYDRGSVSLKFASNTGPHNFTVTQQQTNWDSTAVKENYVRANWGDEVVPYSERGLTIYAHEGNAAWVNGGILYTITGDAPLSTSQVRSIATSL